MKDELKEYRERIGAEEYQKQYYRLYSEAKQHKERYSGMKYDNSKERLQEIKEKYKNGVTFDILEEFVNNIL